MKRDQHPERNGEPEGFSVQSKDAACTNIQSERVLRQRIDLCEFDALLTPCPPHCGGGALGGMLAEI